MRTSNSLIILTSRFWRKEKTFELLLSLSMFLLGLNFPRSFTLLTLYLIAGFWICRQDIIITAKHKDLQFTILCLVIFGLSFSVRQWQLGYWEQDMQSLADFLTITIYPSACLVLGFISRHRVLSRTDVTNAAVSFAIGGLIYVLLALAISHDPWWNITEVFPQGVTVPWSRVGQFSQNVRSVEQRAYPALTFLTCVPITMWQKKNLWHSENIIFLVSGALGLYCIWSTGGRLGYLALALTFTQYVLIVKHKFIRWAIITSIVAVVTLASKLGLLCDERFMLQLTFLGHIKAHPWGGRQISFAFQGCPGQSKLLFSPPPNIMHLPHNIFLDVINDVGVLPSLFLVAASILLTLGIVRYFKLIVKTGAWDTDNCLRFSLIIVIISQSLAQPLLYSDLSMFVISFLLTGALISEFTFQKIIFNNESAIRPR